MIRLVVLAVLLLAALPAAGQAGTVTRTEAAITYTAAGEAAEAVEIGLNGDNGKHYVYAAQGATAPPECNQVEPTRTECDPADGFVVNLLGGDDNVGLGTIVGTATLEVRAGAGGDTIFGTGNADRLYGEAGDDTIDDGAGGDLVDGGPGNDHFTARPRGRDTFTGGAGTDTIDYGNRIDPVTITLAGGADDGESGEGDDLGTEIENAVGSSAGDRITGHPAGSNIVGGAGADTITGNAGEDRIEGGGGDDVIDTRDGRYDSVDCGEGNDTLRADASDVATACEGRSAPDGGGSGGDAPAERRVDNPVRYGTKRQGRRGIRFTSLKVSDLLAGDVVEVRCKGGKRRGCAFTTKRYGDGTGTLSLLSLFKKRPLQPGAAVEIRILRDGWIGKAQRMTVNRRGKLTVTTLCQFVGETTPRACG
jgi:hypothetical protein